MPRFFKRLIRGLARLYLTYTPIKKGRYPLMMFVQRIAGEHITVEVTTKDRGKMKLDLWDEAQFPLYYNIYEWKETPTIIQLVKDCRTVLDIGGNIGQMALLFAQYAQRVHTFEPVPAKADRLDYNIKINGLEHKIYLHSAALSDSIGTIQFYLPTEDNGGIGSIVGANTGEVNVLSVNSDTTDHFILENNVTNIDLIKMDIEGGELFALRGMTGLLGSSNKPIVIMEMTRKMMDAAGYTSTDMLTIMENCGYSCYKFSKNGLTGPLTLVEPYSENYCFLTEQHLQNPNIQRLTAV